MNTMVRWAIALGAVSFAITLWMLTSGPGDPPTVEPDPIAHDAPRDLPGDFDAAVRAAEQTGATPEGLQYQESAGPAVSNLLQDRLASCLTGASPVGQSAFTIVVGVAEDGAVSATWASPETPLASCILHRLAGTMLPPPPIANAWIAANITPDAASVSE